MDKKRLAAAGILIFMALLVSCAICSAGYGRDSPEAQKDEALHQFLEENGLAPDIYGYGMWP